MSTSTDAILFYGYDLAGGDDEWLVNEINEDEVPTWFDEDDPVESMTNRLLAASGFTETDYKVDGYFKRKAQAEARLGVEFDTHCSDESPMYLMAAYSRTARRGYSEMIDWEGLERDRVRMDWDGKLAEALRLLGLTLKTDQRPGWLLVSYWG